MTNNSTDSPAAKTNRHVPVMADETVEQLRISPGMTVIDATVGNAGHAVRIATGIGDSGTLIGIDADPLALEESALYLNKTDATIHLVNNNFANMTTVAQNLGIDTVDAILMDLGLRRGSLEDTGRGFSFRKKDEPLDMRFDPANENLSTAAEVVNQFSESLLADIFYYLADEKKSRQYASAIVAARTDKPIETVGDLVSIIESASPARQNPRRSPATKVFQALRMTVNQELEVLEQGIQTAVSLLKTNGRLVVITFHSGEDRLIKQTFKQLAEQNLVLIDPKKPIKPTRTEIINNKLSRSALLRAVTKI